MVDKNNLLISGFIYSNIFDIIILQAV